MGSLHDTLKRYADGLRHPRTQHFHILDEPKTLCGQSAPGNYSEGLRLLPSSHQRRVDGEGYHFYSWGYYSDIDVVLRSGSRIGKAGHRLSICGPCSRAWPKRVADNAAQRLRTAPPPAPPRVRRAELQGIKDGFLPQRPRPPGTQEMTGHLDEGSKGGGCGQGGAGFLTTFVPWISCSACLVMTDWVLENELFILHGNYLVKALPYPGCIGTLVANLASQPPGFHFNWKLPYKATGSGG